MKTNAFRIFILMTALAALALPFGCGGGGSGSGSVTYDGNTDPAVADSTTSTALAQSALNAIGSVFPTVQVLFPGEGSEPTSLSAESLVELLQRQQTETSRGDLERERNAIEFLADLDKKFGGMRILTTSMAASC